MQSVFGAIHLNESNGFIKLAVLVAICHIEDVDLYAGLNSRNRATVSGTSARAMSMSSAVFCLPRLKRMPARARSERNPIAISTWDGSIAPDEHAAPVETARPLRSREMTIDSPSI